MKEEEYDTEESLEEVIEALADECEASGEKEFSVVLYAYLGAANSGDADAFAKHCQDFSKGEIKIIKKSKTEGIKGRRKSGCPTGHKGPRGPRGKK